MGAEIAVSPLHPHGLLLTSPGGGGDQRPCWLGGCEGMRGDGEMDDPRYVKGAVGALWLMGDGMRQVGFFWEGGFSPELSFEGLTVLKLFLGFVRSSCFFVDTDVRRNCAEKTCAVCYGLSIEDIANSTLRPTT